MMTKKDYELIAKVTKSEYERAMQLADYHKLIDEYTSHRRWVGHAEGVHQTALNIAHALQKENSRFDKDKFLIACGIELADRLWDKTSRLNIN